MWRCVNAYYFFLTVKVRQYKIFRTCCAQQKVYIPNGCILDNEDIKVKFVEQL